MQSGKPERNTALTTLRERLEDGLAKARLTKTQLAARAELGRTTVQTAFQSNGPAPSAGTVAALAQALQLPKSELLELRRIAVDGNRESAAGDNSGDGASACPGRPIKQWNPHDLEVHPAGPALIRPDSKAGIGRVLPGYVVRAHDLVLADVVHAAGNGSSALVMLVGSSSTGKTRACWEAVQPLAGRGWRLWHPFDPTRAEAALSDLMRVGTRTVIWLNEAQHYLGNVSHGERIAAAVHQLLTDPARGPVLVLGTLWPEYVAQLTAQPVPRAPDPHSRARELLAGRTVEVPEAFDREALAKAAALAQNGDRLLADALTRTSTDGRMTQDLAGAPELLRRHQQGTPAAQAILNAAMDARRLGVGLHLPQAFLTDAATDYLADSDYDQLPEDWAERVYAELAEPVHGKQAPLRRTGLRPRRRPPGKPDSTAVASTAATGSGPMFRLADYLEQHGRTSRHLLCPPASFWHAAHAHLVSPDDLNSLANAAQDRHRLQWAHHLRYRAAAAGSTQALIQLAELARVTGNRDSLTALYEQAADAGNTTAMVRLAKLKEESEDRVAAALFEQATNTGDVSTWRLTSQVTRPADLRFFPGQRRRPFSTLRDVESRSTRERPLCMSLSVDVPAGEALDVLSRFRVEFYECLYARADALFELTDAVLCADGPVKTLVELSLAVEHRRGHGALYAALDRGWLEPTRLRRTLAGLPLPKAADGRIVLAVDVSNWLRPDAPTSDGRLFCHVYGRGDRKTDQFVPGWPYSFVAALESGRTSWVALLDAVRLGPADDATLVTAAQLRDVVQRLTRAGHWRPGDPEILIVMDAGYDVAYLTHALADLPVMLLGRLRSDRVMLRDPGPPRSGPKGGRPRRHGGVLTFAKPDSWHEPDVTTATDTTRYGKAETIAWDRMHPRLTHRGPWLNHAKEELPILHGTLVRLQVERLPGDRDPKPVWLWCSTDGATPADVDRWWQSFLRRFDLEHTFRLMKQTLGWTAPKVRHADTADLWTWLIIAAHTQLRLARPLAEDLRRPWERSAEPRRLTPARVRRGFRNVRATAARPSAAPKPSRPGPGRPAGSKNRQRATRHDVGKTVKRAESIKEHQARRG